MKHTLFAGLVAAALAVPAYAGDYMIMAPAAPGGGWDQTARTMQEVLGAEGISGSVQVQNVPGAGGTDHIAVGLLAKAAGVDPTKINYIAYSGGGEALAAILGSQVTAGISGLGEFKAQADAGTLRILAVTSEERIEGVDAPTLKEAGLDVVLQNWRMVAAAPGISADQKAAILADVEKMVNSASWQTALETKGWANTYLAGDAFQAQLDADIASTETILKDIGLVK